MSSAVAKPLAYRQDIDGLRALAVLSVVFYHAFPIYGRGGFVGVDIFFVISGYLISTIIFEGVETGRFSYLDFYDRRIRRIFPALLLVLASCLVFALTLAIPIDARQIGKHMVGGGSFVSNLMLWNEAGYFDGSSETKPLLHLWSLSVEEQYYLAWPLLVSVAYARSRRLLAMLLGSMVASFALSIALIGPSPVAAFYSPAPRMWELLVGSLLAYLVRFSGGLAASIGAVSTRLGIGHRRPSPNLLGWTGAALLAAAIGITTHDSAFPGWWALLPTLGAFFVIGAGPAAWVNRAVLGNRVAVFFGKISYPLYLWHWPLLAFPKIVDGGASRNVRVAAVVASIVLAWLTYRFVESPIRFGKRRARTPIALTAGIGVMIVAGAALYLSDGAVFRYPVEMRSIATAEFKFSYAAYRASRCFLEKEQSASEFAPECSALPTTPGAQTLWLWGDSHLASLYPGLAALTRGDPRYAVSQFTSGVCPPLMDFDIRINPNCRSTNDWVMKRIAEHAPAVLVMGANWTQYNGRDGWRQFRQSDVEEAVRRVKALGVGQVILVGQLPRWTLSEPSVALKEWQRTGAIPASSLAHFNLDAFAVNEIVKVAAAATGSTFLSPQAVFCTGTSGCALTVERNGIRYPVAWDDAHLTVEASTTLVERWRDELLTPRP